MLVVAGNPPTTTPSLGRSAYHACPGTALCPPLLFPVRGSSIDLRIAGWCRCGRVGSRRAMMTIEGAGMRRWLAVVAVLSMVVAGLGAPGGAQTLDGVVPVPVALPGAPDLLPVPPVGPNLEAQRPGWVPASSVVSVAAASAVVGFGAVPLRVEKRGGFSEPVRATAEVLPPGVARQLSPFGAAIRLSFERPGRAERVEVGAVDVVVDFSAVGLATGGGVADRLELWWFSGCGERADAELGKVFDCALKRTVPASFDLATRSVSAGFDQEELTAKALAALTPEESAKAKEALAAGGGSVLALGAGGTGPSSNYTATPMASVSSYQVGLFTGSAELSYEIPVPAPAAGEAPRVVLSYSSAAVDALTSGGNTQTGGVGVGWSFDPGAITRLVADCPAQGGLCSSTDFAISLNGVSSRLVNQSGSIYYLQSDPRWKAELRTDGPAGHPDAQKEYWLVTTPDGVKYRFGGEFEPEGGADQNSVQYATFYSTSACPTVPNLCSKAYRWNLDRVEDPNGNVVSYFYRLEFNWYRPATVTYNRQYIRGAYLDRIDYTRRVGVVQAPNARVQFSWELRCGSETTFGQCAWPADFPDTPGDLVCAAGGACGQGSQTFWSQLRLGSVATMVRRGTSTTRWSTLGTYDLVQSHPTPPTQPGDGDPSEAKLALVRLVGRPGGGFEDSGFEQLRAWDTDQVVGAAPFQPLDVGSDFALTGLGNNDYAVFEDLWFGQGTNGKATSVLIRAASAAASTVNLELRIGSTTGTLLTTVPVTPTGGNTSWQTFSQTFAGYEGVGDLYVVARGPAGADISLNWVRFKPNQFTAIPGLPPVDYLGTGFEWRRNRWDSGGAGNGVSSMVTARVKTVTNELGGQIGFTYASLTCGTPNWQDNHTYCWQEPDGAGAVGTWMKYVVTGMTATDASFTGNAAASFTYAYTNPSWHISNDPTQPSQYHSDFRGHAQVVVIDDAGGARREVRFFQGMHGDSLGGGTKTVTVSESTGTSWQDSNWLAGRELETRVLKSNGATVVSRNRTEFAAALSAGSGLYGAYFVAPSKVESFAYTSVGAVDGTRTTSYTYDSYGNVTLEVHSGTAGSTRTIQRSFSPNTSAWLVDRPYWVKLWSGSAPGAAGQEKAYTRFVYDGLAVGATPTKGNVSRIDAFHTATSSHNTGYGYDSYGRATTVTDPRGKVTTTVYDPNHGYVTSVTNPLTHVTAYGHDNSARTTSITDPNGKVTTLAFDDYSRLVSVWRPTEPTVGPASLTFSYDPAARPAWTKTRVLQDTAGPVYLDSWSYTDGFGRGLQTQIPYRDANGGLSRAVSATWYDGRGLAARQSSPFQTSGTAGSSYFSPSWTSLPNYHQYTFDEARRVTQDATWSGGSQLWAATVAYSGRTVDTTDPDAVLTRRTSDMFGNLVSVLEPWSGGTTTYSYDLADRLTTVVDAQGRTTATTTYNLLGWKTQLVDADAGTWNYTYDGAGNLASQQDGRGQSLYFEYDNGSRLIKKRANSPTGTLLAEWLYDPAGFKGMLSTTKAYTAAGTVEVQYSDYDDRYRVEEVRLVVPGAGGGTFAERWSYNRADDVLTHTLPGNTTGGLGEVLTYTYDTSTGNPATLTSSIGSLPLVQSVTYDPLGRITNLRHGPGGATTNRTFGYSPTNLRLTTVRAGSGLNTSDLMNLTLIEFTSAGDLLRLSDVVHFGQWLCFSYSSHRLSQALTSPTSGCGAPGAGTAPFNHSYTYDSVGNISSITGTGGGIAGTYTYSPTRPHQVVAAGSSTFGYDNAGNQTSRTVGGVTSTLTWDESNRLASVSGGGTTTTFLRDADGRLVKRTVGSTSTVYVGDDYEWDSAAGATSWYWFGGERVAFRTSAGVNWWFGDPLGSTATVYTATGQTVRQRYYPFGGIRYTDNPATDVGFTGQRRDPSTGLMDYRARYYDPAVGRFISPDTIVPGLGNPQNLNRYSYVLNNPATLTDPTGHCAGRSICIDGVVTTTAAKTTTFEKKFTYTAQAAVGGGYVVDPRLLGETTVAANQATISRVQLAAVAPAATPLWAIMVAEATPIGVVTAAYEAITGKNAWTGERASGPTRVLDAVSVFPLSGLVRFADDVIGVGAGAGRIVKNMLGTGPDEAVFWSGIRGGDSTAAAWVSKNGGATLESTLAERGIQLPAWDPNNPASVAAWRSASAGFAAGASGNVRVLQTDAVRVNSIWAEVEFPALIANPNVTSLTAVNPETGIEVLLWHR